MEMRDRHLERRFTADSMNEGIERTIRKGVTSSPVTLPLWCGVVLLAVVGVAAAMGRGAFLSDWGSRTESVRQQLLHWMHRTDPAGLDRAAEAARFDSRFAAHPVVTLLHVVPGAIFLILAPLQLSSLIRSRRIGFHRWSGRALLFAGFAAGSTGLYFGLLMPYGGPREAGIILLVGGLFLVALSRAFVAIRKRREARHREWMIRAFAVAIGVSTVRIVAAVFDLALTPAGFRPADLFVLSLWTGWAITLGAAEVWIRRTRPRADSIAARTESTA